MFDDDALRRALAPHVFDGGEAHNVADYLVDAVLAANGDPSRVNSARIDAKRRLCALLKDTIKVDAALYARLFNCEPSPLEMMRRCAVLLEAARNAFAELPKQQATIAFGELLREFAE